jgi:hypothetical protein
MLTLDLPTEPYWLDLPRGVRVEIRPVTTAVMAAAQTAAQRRLAALREADTELDPDLARGLAFAFLAKALARHVVTAWEGVPPTPEARPMADSTRRVSVRLSLDDAASVKTGLREVGETGQREMQRITRSAEMASRSLSLLGPVLAGLSIGGVAAMVRSAVDAVGGLGELADAAGVSTDALQAFGYAATQVGLSNEELQRSLQALTRRIADAAIGEQAAQQAFTRLGISFRDTAGNARATEAVMAELAERIAGLSDPAERTAAATAVFGDRLGQRMIPFLLQGRDGLERLTAEALRFGAIADADLIAKADEASDKIAALERAFSSLARNLLAQVAPALSTVANAINRVMTGASLAERRASLEQNRDALQRRLEELESEAAGQAALSSQPRRGTIQRGAVGVAREQAGVTRTGLIAEIRQQLDEVQREIATLEAEARTAEERARQILNPDSRAGGGNEAALRRQRAAEDIARLLPSLIASADSAGFPPVAPLLAGTGDVVLAPDPARLGVVLDAGRLAFVGPHGLLRAPITHCTHAWRIG